MTNLPLALALRTHLAADEATKQQNPTLTGEAQTAREVQGLLDDASNEGSGVIHRGRWCKDFTVWSSPNL